LTTVLELSEDDTSVADLIIQQLSGTCATSDASSNTRFASSCAKFLQAMLLGRLIATGMYAQNNKQVRWFDWLLSGAAVQYLLDSTTWKR
jgi:hypothetical protein